MFENAKWISCSDRRNEHGSYIMRKVFRTDGKADFAEMSVCGLGYGRYYINGEEVTDEVLSTPFTNYDCRVYYNTYDVTEYIKEGTNVISAYLGNGFYNDNNAVWEFSTASWKHHPKLLMTLDITLNNGENLSINSGTDWKCIPGPAVYNHLREGEAYDRRLYPDGFDLPDFDDSSWPDAFHTRAPGGELFKNEYPKIKRIKRLKAKPLGNGIYDFGENTSGFIHFKGTAEAGKELLIEYSERYENGDINTEAINFFNKNGMRHSDKYTFKGVGTEEWEPSFVYHGFRYVKLTGEAKITEIYAVVIHTDLEIIGEIETDNELINKIHSACRRSTLTNFHGFPTDCPHREQNGWTGDAQWSASQALMNYEIYDAYKKWMLDFKDAQRKSGQLPGIIPTSGWGYNWGSGPAWDSALFVIPWECYMITGKKDMPALMYENMKAYLNFADSMADGNIVDFGLWDWCAADEKNICPRAATDTAYYYYDYVVAAKTARLIGENPERFMNKAKDIKEAFRNVFLKDEKNLSNQTFLAVCLYFGLLENGEKAEFAKRLAAVTKENGYHIMGGTIGTKCIFSALADNGYNDVICKVVENKDYPGYGYWIENGMTTFCENWDMSSSLNHHMFSEVDNWLYKYVAGININENGLTVSPVKSEGISFVKAKHRDISVEINKNRLFVKVPKKAKIIWNGSEHCVAAGEYTFD